MSELIRTRVTLERTLTRSEELPVAENKPWYTQLVHAAMGAGVAAAIWFSSGHHALAAYLASVIAAGFKEGSDIYADRDTLESGVVDALWMVAGAVAFVLIAKCLGI